MLNTFIGVPDLKSFRCTASMNWIQQNGGEDAWQCSSHSLGANTSRTMSHKEICSSITNKQHLPLQLLLALPSIRWALPAVGFSQLVWFYNSLFSARCEYRQVNLCLTDFSGHSFTSFPPVPHIHYCPHLSTPLFIPLWFFLHFRINLPAKELPLNSIYKVNRICSSITCLLQKFKMQTASSAKHYNSLI